MKKFYFVCEVCEREISKDNKLVNSQIIFNRLLHKLFLPEDYSQSELKLENRICKNCYKTLSKTVELLKKGGSSE